MNRFGILIVLAFASAALAADPTGFVVYRAADLKGYRAKLAPKLNAMQFATEKLDTLGNHFTMVAYREGSGQVEIHEHMADLFVVVSGDATLVAGGEAAGAKATEPGELRGGSIRGGKRVPLGPGDIVHIPAGMPHQLFLDPGKKFTYFIVKIEGK